MKLYNKNKNGFSHTVQSKVKTADGEVIKPITYTLAAGATADVPDEVAEIWLKIEGVEKYIAPEDLKKAQKQAEAKAKEEIDKLSKELETVKTENEALKAENQKLAEAEAKAKEEIKGLKEAAKKANSDK